MANPTNGELALMIKNLDTKLDEGFDAIHRRQDLTNGKVLKNEEFRIQQQTANKFLYGLLTLIVLPVGFLMVNYFLNT